MHDQDGWFVTFQKFRNNIEECYGADTQISPLEALEKLQTVLLKIDNFSEGSYYYAPVIYNVCAR